MSKYVIAFKESMGRHREYYSGGSYMYDGEKYVNYGRGIQDAKRYTSRKIAENSAQKLARGNCVNVTPYYEIIEVKE